MENFLVGVFWISVLFVVFVTLGYPIFLLLTGPFIRRNRRFDDTVPSVTLIIAAYNEEQCIAQKLQNALELDYPSERLEIIVASDGSSDRTDEIVGAFADLGITLRRFDRMGKTAMQNRMAESAAGEILVFSDANAFYRADAIRKLVRNFADPEIACVSGQLVYRTEAGGAGDCERSYWDYEKFMKQRESDLSSLIGANGSIYAVRKADYVEIGEDLISDLVEPLAQVLKGKRVVYEPEAVSSEEASPSYTVEFKRKVRILTRSINGVLHMRALFNPFRHGIFSFQLVMHKLFRYLVPLFLILGVASLTGLAHLGYYRPLFLVALLVMVFFAWVGQSGRIPPSNPILRGYHLMYYYLVVNYALVLAWINVIRGSGYKLWVPERSDGGRTSNAAGVQGG